MKTESIEEIADRLYESCLITSLQNEEFLDSIAFAQKLMKDPAFRRLMAEELVKVDMEPIYYNNVRHCFIHSHQKTDEDVEFFTQDQLTAAVMKEREECAKKFDKLSNIVSYQPEDIAQMIRSRTERTE